MLSLLRSRLANAVTSAPLSRQAVGAAPRLNTITPVRTLRVFERHKRVTQKRVSKSAKLEACPQKKGVVLRVFTASPRKPNSARRKVVRVLMSNKYAINAYVPGIGHNLQKHSQVLVRGHRIRDLPGVNYAVIRNKYDLREVKGRTNARSKYGVRLNRFLK